MTLDDYLSDFETNFTSWDGTFYTGKIDNNELKALCFYNSKRQLAYETCIGGKANKTTHIKPITILLRYTKNQKNAEIMAKSIFDFYNEREFTINNKRIFVQMEYNEPICLGTDENNVFEYSIEFNLYEEV